MNQMADRVRAELARLVESHGSELLDDARRVRAMLADAVPGSTAEANLLGLAISAGVPAKLRERGAAAAPAIARELEQNSSVQSEDASWAVRSLADAMGLHPSTVTEDRPRSGGTRSSGDLIARVGGREFVIDARVGATVGRDPDCTITVDRPGVSRLHGRIERRGDTWEYVDQRSTQGTFAGGVSVSRLAIGVETELTLGQGPDAARLTLVPAAPMPATAGLAASAAAAASPATVLPGQRPGGVLAMVQAAPTELGGGGIGGDGGAGPSDTVTVTLGGVTRTVAPGATLTIGREADCDLVATAPTVSRHHARVEWVDGRWRLHDLDSTSGTWKDGRRIDDLILDGTEEVVLGDAARGESVQLVTDGSTTAPSADSHAIGTGALRRRLPRPTRVTALVAAAVVLVMIVGGAAAVWTTRGGTDAGLSDDELAKGTVFLLASNDDKSWSGSGVIVDAEEGLILTNAHVAAPSAVGMALPNGGDPSYVFSDEADENPRTIEVWVNEGLDTSAEPRFTAEVVAADGYLDLAVLRVTDKLSGTPVGAGDLERLTEVPIADSDTVRTGDPITYLGYPGAADSPDPTLTSGAVASAASDDRLDSARAILNTSAGSSHGNSGGLAANADGRMVGVPTWGRIDRDSGEAVLSGLRPVNFALPLLKAARGEKTYTSPWAVAAPDAAEAEVALAEPGRRGTARAECAPDSETSPVYAFGVSFTGMPGGEHTDIAGRLTNVDTGDSITVATPYPTRLAADDCVTLSFDALTTGTYELKIGLGGDLHVATTRRFTVR